MSFPNPRIFPGGVKTGQIVGDPYYFADFHKGGYGTTTGPMFASTANVADWLYTVRNGSTPTFIVADSERSGVLTASCGATTDTHGLDCQLNGEGYSVVKDKDIYWEMRCKIPAEVAELDWVIGLCNTDTSVLTGCNNALVFRSGAVDAAPLNAASADIIASAGDDMAGSWTATTISEVDTGQDWVADEYRTFAIHLTVDSQGNKRARFYIDGEEVMNVTSNIPDEDTFLTPTFAIENTDAMAAAGRLEIDYILCTQVR